MDNSNYQKPGSHSPFIQIDVATLLEVPIVIFLLRLCLLTADHFPGCVGLFLTAVYLLSMSTGRGALITTIAVAAATGALWWLAGIFPENCACDYFRLVICQFFG